MKNIIIILAIITASLCCQAQNIGIKLPAPQTFTVIPAHTQNADSISILNTDWQDKAVYADIQFFKNGNAKEVMRLKLWDTFKPYSEATDAKIITRVKNKLNIP